VLQEQPKIEQFGKRQRLRAACENKFKLIDKYLPSLKAVEMTIPDSSALETLSTSALIKRFHELIGETSP
jgi:hypothetical protein